MKKILVYCQHVLGVGHLARMSALLQCLQGAEVTLVLGGPRAEIAFPDYIHIVQLPGLHMDAEFSGLQPVDTSCQLEDIKKQRKKQLLELVDTLQPDLLLIELFPFGRCGFRFELDPLLAHVREYQKNCRVVCSVRDILVERENAVKFEQRVVTRLNAYFDLLLIHADSGVIRLDQTFSRMGDIRTPVKYTGYIAERGDTERSTQLRQSLQLAADEQLVVVSAGSGSVGFRLLEASLEAHALLSRKQKIRLQLFSGPYVSDERFAQLSAMADSGATIERFSNHFPDWLAIADLSVSMGGYNTTMNVMAAGCPALIFPFAQNHEQRMRAERLAALAPVQIIEEADLQPQRLAELMNIMLRKEAVIPEVSLDGAEETARIVLAEKGGELA